MSGRMGDRPVGGPLELAGEPSEHVGCPSGHGESAAVLADGLMPMTAQLGQPVAVAQQLVETLGKVVGILRFVEQTAA